MGLNNFTGNNHPANSGGSGMPTLAQLAQGGGMDPQDMLINYNERFKNSGETLFRDDVISQTISVLIGMNKPNPLLVGSAGVGKTRIVEDIARRIANNDPSIPGKMSKSTIYELPLSSLVAGAGIVGQLEERVTSLIDWATDPANDAILFIDEVHMLVNDRMAIYDKVAQIFKPALARGDIRVIGATTLQESRMFDDDPAFQRRVSRLIVDELTREQTVVVLEKALPSYVAHYKNKILVQPEMLEQVAVIADKHAKAGHHRPDNALTLLDRAMADTWVQHRRAVAKATADGDTAMVQALNSLPMVPVTEKRMVNTALRLMTGHATKENLDLSAMRSKLDRIKGQDEVLNELMEMLRRDDLGVYPRTTPITWMFAGSSGAGKTEAAKIIAQELTGQPPIILNMTEYIHDSAINRLIGAPAGYVGSDSNAELPFDTLESNPYRVILLDEIEKSDKAVQRLFLSAFDEGYIKTARGKVIDFSKAIIIATTNAARESAGKASLGFGGATEPSQANLVRDLNNWFDPEFLARFSKIVAFNQINKELYRTILTSTYQLQRQEIETDQPRLAANLPAQIPDDVLAQITEGTYVPSQGARPAVRAARQYIEDTLLQARIATSGPTTGSVLDRDEDLDGEEVSDLLEEQLGDIMEDLSQDDDANGEQSL